MYVAVHPTERWDATCNLRYINNKWVRSMLIGTNTPSLPTHVVSSIIYSISVVKDIF